MNGLEEDYDYPFFQVLNVNVGIVGANGFVGRNLASRLTTEGFRVRAYGRSDIDLVKLESLACLEDHDAIVNCAAYVGTDKEKLFSVNVQGVISLCTELNERAKPPYLLHLSSGAVYGYMDSPALFDSPAAPVGDYALSKFLADEVVRLHYRGASAVARLYYPYGEGQAQERLMPRLVGRVLNREPIDISIHSSCPLINPLHIDDLCDELLALTLGSVEGVHLLGGSEIVSIRDVALLIGRILGVDPVFRETEGAKSSMYCNGRSSVSLDLGLRRLIESMQGDQ
ncbi:NAD-dependent epimerase/dehydratase family protein [Pseudomonas gingeri]|uniref:NAD(P)-dependent oxidoreductase n=1 Tax=Pseudomonas gingeri TaxID=117681 RepID=A0A7Y7Y3C5_9PSED|nr:NAD(P)-dependent oxidoreductase [Pseudomonas gingeri]NWC16984.1 NAD(P)-dependent oxidoreductase [Pseudomonas gingeri]